MCNKDNKGWKFVCMGVEFLAFNVLKLKLRKSKTGLSIRNILLQSMSGVFGL